MLLNKFSTGNEPLSASFCLTHVGPDNLIYFISNLSLEKLKLYKMDYNILKGQPDPTEAALDRASNFLEARKTVENHITNTKQ